MLRKKKSEEKKTPSLSSLKTTQPKLAQKVTAKKSTVAGRKKIVAKKAKSSKARETGTRTQKTAEGVYCFYLRDGRSLATLAELHDALCVMDDEQYAYHTTGRNDFAAWVDQVLNEADVALGLLSASTKNDAERVIKETLTLYC